MSSMNWRREQNEERQESLAEQRRREDEAVRLTHEVPELSSLRIRMDEARPDGHSSHNPYTKHVVVASAPALFEIRCSEVRCDGVHDLTRAILDELRRSHTAFEGESPCGGVVGPAQTPCDRTLRYHVAAQYRGADTDPKRPASPTR